MQIFIKSLTSKTLTLDVDYSNTIEDIKQKIYDRENIPLKYQKLEYAGKLLENPRTLSDYNILCDSTLFLSFKLLGI
jgi:hypothetical protein